MEGVNQSNARQTTMDITTLGIDVSKNSFHVIGTNRAGKPIFRQKFTRAKLAEFAANHPPCLIGMEACPGSQHLARKFEEFSHQVKLMPAQFVKPYVKSDKNDFNDAAAIAEAVRRPTMRFVTTKIVEQHDLQALHRVRERLIRTRTSIICQIRSFMLENGITVRTGRVALARALPAILEDESQPLSDRMRALLHRLREQWRFLDLDINAVSKELKTIARSRDDCRRLLTVPGVGPLVATALIASIGNGRQFKRGRELAAWLGLVPREHSTGGKQKLLGISKRGSSYLRKLMIHGARSCYLNMNREPHRMGQWIEGLAQRRTHRNIIVVAMANKLARICWAVIRDGSVYHYVRA
jgi:transposase